MLRILVSIIIMLKGRRDVVRVGFFVSGEGIVENRRVLEIRAIGGIRLSNEGQSLER